MILTRKLINAGIGKGGRISSVQFRLLGLSYPVMDDWKKSLLGKDISLENYRKYLSLKGVDGIKASKIISQQNKEKRMSNLDLTSYSRPVADEIKDKLKNKPITLMGMLLLDSYLEKLQRVGKLSDRELTISKQIEETYKDNKRLALDDSYVYAAYARTDESGKIIVKIGFSKNPKSRMRDLRVAIPGIELIAYEKGSMQTENDLHREFSVCSIDGEWFAFNMSKQKFVELFHDTVEALNYDKDVAYQCRQKLLRKWKI